MKKIAILALFILAACARPPEPPAGAKKCGSVWECPDGQGCRFPRVNSFAVCMPGGDDRWQAAKKR